MPVFTDTRPVPAQAGVGLRIQHMPMLAAEADDVPLRTPWLEVHSENFLADGGPRMAMLRDIARRYPISCHGVGLSLGSAQGLDPAHLAKLKALFSRVRPALVSEHVSWSVVDGAYLNDLLPLPYTAETVATVADNVAHAQDVFGRQILIENPSSYLGFSASTMSEWDFLSRVVARTGCGILLDVNNVYVSAVNNGFDAQAYLSQIDAAAVGEIHLAGHSVEGVDDDQVLIDTHSTHVCDSVWDLYRAVLRRTGPVPTLIEWDMDIPPFTDLLREAAKAQVLLDQQAARVSRVA